jgi:hypothetical protein
VILAGQNIRALLGVATNAMFLEDGSLTPLPTGADGLRDPRIQGLL